MGKKVVFERGDKVEVCSKEQGFVGSYYEATIVEHVLEASEHILRHKYRVKYTHLVKEHDQSEPLEEIVKTDDVRPPPPPPPPRRAYSPRTLRLVTVESKPKFVKGDRVDAFDNDGWWVGTVLGKQGEDYIVHFGNYGDKNAYPSTKLRRHLEYRNGNWHHPKKLRPIQVWRQSVL